MTLGGIEASGEDFWLPQRQRSFFFFFFVRDPQPIKFQILINVFYIDTYLGKVRMPFPFRPYYNSGWLSYGPHGFMALRVEFDIARCFYAII